MANNIASPGVRSVNNRPIWIIVGAAALFVGITGVVAYERAATPAWGNLRQEAIAPPAPPSMPSTRLVPNPPGAMPALIVSHAKLPGGDGWCQGTEALCMQTRTDNLPDMLGKVAGMLPAGTDTRYRLKVLVEVADE